MGTLVQSPDLVQSTITGAQTAAKPVERGLGTFLSDLIPVAQGMVDQHVKDNEAHLRALGQNDVLNDKFSEVSRLGRKSYAEGRTYQTVVNSRAVLAQDFKSKVDASDDPEEWQTYIKEYSDATIQNIKEADLPPEVKAGLYEAQLKNNATYMSMIDKRTTKLNQDMAYETKQVLLANMVDDLTNEPLDAEDTVYLFQSNYETLYTLLEDAHPDKSREDIDKDIQQGFVAALDTVFEGLTAKTDEESLKRVNMFAEVVEGGLGHVSLDAQKRFKQAAIKYGREFVEKHETEQLSVLENMRYALSLDTEAFSMQDLQDFVSNTTRSTSFSPEHKLRVSKAVNAMAYDKQVALHQGEVFVDPWQVSQSDTYVQGLDGAEVLRESRAKAINQMGVNEAGFFLMDLYGSKAEKWDEGIRMGAELAVGTFLPYVSLTDNEVKTNEYSELHNQSYQRFSDMYRQAAAGNALKAREMLAGIPTDQREVFITAMENGESLESVRRKMQNYEQTKASHNAAREAVGKLSKEDIAIGGIVNKFFGNTSGMPEHVQDAFLFHTQQAGLRSINTLSKSVKTGSPKQAGLEITKNFLPSQGGLSPYIASAADANTLRYLSESGARPLDLSYITRAADTVRTRDAKRLGVNPKHSVAYFQDRGGELVIDYYNSEGVFGGDGTLKESFVYRTADFVAEGHKLYNKEKQRKAEVKKDLTKQNPNLVVGKLDVSDRASGGATQIPVTVEMSKNFGYNSDIAKDILGDIAYHYGYSSKAINQDNGTTAVGIGFDSGSQPEWAVAHIAKAASNPKDSPEVRNKKVAQATAEIITRQLTNVPLMAALRDVGIPKPTQDLYPRQHQKTMKTLYTTAILHGKEGLFGDKSKGFVGVVDVYNADTLDVAKLRFRQSKLYSKKHPKRNAHYLEAIEQHFKLRGK